jgi:type I restriction enzyme S subunit
MAMNKVKWVRLGDYIEQSDSKNSQSLYGIDSIKGISTNKEFIDTKANLDGVSLSSYKLVPPKYFAFVPDTSRRGDKMALGFNDSNCTYLISSIYCVFYIKDHNELLPEYLYLIYCRPEFDRFARYNSWGSAREVFSWDDMCSIEIPLPSLSEQQKVVNAWKAFREIKEQNEAKAAPLMQLCQSYIQELKHKYPAQEIGPYIEESNERNKNGYFGADALMGVCSEGTFIKSIANTSGLVFNNYKIVHRGDFAYSNRINVGSIALRYDDDCIISPSYAVFRIKNECRDKLLNEYLAIWFRRAEFLRATLFFAFGTIKDDFSHREMCRVKMPIPPLDVQRAIVNIYKCANEAKQIAAEADRLSREVCPALLQHVIQTC